jgi:hypothetical protein
LKILLFSKIKKGKRRAITGLEVAEERDRDAL